jgi:hypothetical protein
MLVFCTADLTLFAMSSPVSFFVRLALAGCAAAPVALRAWDYAGHRIVNELALASLPPDFPAFVRAPAAAERIAFLAGEPDRWRNTSDLPFHHVNGLDHYLDVEELALAGIDVGTLTPFRYAFVAQFAAGRAAHPDKFRPIDPARNLDHSREWPGFAPWAVAENYGRLKSAFSYLRAFEELGTPEEVANAQANVLYVMGVLGHYVGDLAQPLHTTVYHNGWFGPNPQGYTTWNGFHSWIDGGFIAKAGITAAEIAPRVKRARAIRLTPRPDGRDPVFVAVVAYLLKQHAQVEPLYKLEQAGKLNRDDRPADAQGRAFIAGQLRQGGEMLGALWFTAWRTAAPDTFLHAQLLKRRAEAGEK